jgi:ceramide glucosyltransferase
MNIAHTIPEMSSLLLSFCDLCLAVAFVACVFTLIEAGFVIAFSGEEAPPHPQAQPPVTVLKPLHGVEPGLSVRLAAFCQQDYDGAIQVLCGTQDSASPAIGAVRGMQRQLPDGRIEIAVDPRSHGANGKLSNLVNMMPRARHDILVLSDADIVVGPRYLVALTALLSVPEVGAATCLYHGISGEGLWTRLSALAVNSHFLPQAIASIGLHLAKPCCGATIALRRSTLDRIGGLGAFVDELADDHAIGVAVRSAGYEVVTAPFLVGHRCFEDSLRELLLHQIRIARTIRSIDPVGYVGTIITHPWPLALIGMMSGSTAAAVLAVASLASRVTLCRCVERRFGLPRENYWLIPLQDVIAFAVYMASFFGATVHWRGSDYRVATDGTLIEDKT